MTAKTCTFLSHSPEATERFGAVLAAMLPLRTVVALRGELASGKTCLVRGMAARCAPAQLVSSPTFTLVNEYGDSPRLYHVDLYRLNAIEEFADLGYEDLFEPDGLCVVEWAERAEPLLPAKRLDVFLEHAGETDRTIRIVDSGILPQGWDAQLRAALSS